ncbi:hypothetical protein B566_EDAN011607, partial [Ephemera danica]
MANTSFLISYLAPSSRHGILFMHATLILGFILFCTWAWNIICAADVFTWNLAFMLFNVGQLLYIVYQMRPVKFDPELEESYQTLFYPFKVSRLSFKRMFLDSPEFESSRTNTEDKFKVSIVAASSCRYVYWMRTALDYLFTKEPYLATVLTTLVARDITTKLYAMNTK